MGFWAKLILFIIGGVAVGLLLSAMLPHGVVLYSGPGRPPVVTRTPPITTYAPWVLLAGGLILGAIGATRGKDEGTAMFGFAGTLITAAVTLLGKS